MFKALKKFVTSQSMWLAYSNIWSQLLYGIAIIYVARQLLPSQFSLVAIAIAAIPIAVTFADWGTNSFYTRELSSGRMQRNLWRALFRNQIIVAAFFGVATAVVLSLYISISIGILTGLAVFSLQSFQSSQVLLRANSQFGSISKNNMIYRLPLFTLPVCQNFAPKLLPVCFIALIALGQILGSLNLWRTTRKTLQVGKYSQKISLSDHWKRSGRIAWIPILIQLKGLDIAIWAALSGSTLSGNYGAVNRFGQPTEILAQSAVAVEYTRWSKVKSVQEALELSSSTKLQLSLSLLASAFLAIFGNWLAPLLLGDSYKFAGPMLRLVGFASLATILCLFLVTLLIALQMPMYALQGIVLLLLIQFPVLIVLASIMNNPLAGPLALITGTLASVFFMTLKLAKSSGHRGSEILESG
jgi:O-antigen/teichoic acid export membrane protein